MTDREQLRAKLLERLAKCVLPVEERENKSVAGSNFLLYRIRGEEDLKCPTQNQNDVLIACIKFLLEDGQ